MKKAKSTQRIWAFLLAFVLTVTTIGSDGLTITAAEGEKAAVETIEVSEEDEANLNNTEDNISEGSEKKRQIHHSLKVRRQKMILCRKQIKIRKALLLRRMKIIPRQSLKKVLRLYLKKVPKQYPMKLR